ncbi:MAG: RHS repeat-associated core domain-containing protein [Xanthomonadales bacterium]|nr:RHS repeat-associated core domain-containing protein [Xanthomonadales bacterium]
MGRLVSAALFLCWFTAPASFAVPEPTEIFCDNQDNYCCDTAANECSKPVQLKDPTFNYQGMPNPTIFDSFDEAKEDAENWLTDIYDACSVEEISATGWHYPFWIGGEFYTKRRNLVTYRVVYDSPSTPCSSQRDYVVWFNEFTEPPWCPDPTSIYVSVSQGYGPYYEDLGTIYCKKRIVGGSCAAETSDPVRTDLGGKMQRETDYAAPNSMLRFQRTFNGGHVSVRSGQSRGVYWHNTWSRRIDVETQGANIVAFARRPEGFDQVFWLDGIDYVARANSKFQLESVGGQWILTTAQDQVETYAGTGELIRVEDPRSGTWVDLTYDINGNLDQVEDHRGRTLGFTFNGNDQMTTMTNPAGQLYTYAWDAEGRLSSVTYPDNRTRTYHYEDTSFPFGLTGITDENGDRWATYTYDWKGRVATESFGTGVNTYSFAYTTSSGGIGKASVTDPLGLTTDYFFSLINGVNQLTRVTNPCESCGSNTDRYYYDANGNVNQTLDFEGTRTDYLFDLTRNLEISRTEGKDYYGQERIVETDWHASFRQPVEIRVKDGAGTLETKTQFSYSTSGQMLTRTEVDPTTSNTRAWTYDFCDAAEVTAGTCPFEGLLQSVDGPRTDVTDVTSYEYYDTATSTHEIGDLHKIINALGHETEYLSYDANGRPLQIEDANGVVTTLTYHQRGWLLTSTTDGQTTTMAYDDAGQVTRITQPNGAYIDYEYDEAHRLTALEDNFGNRIEYTLDNAGNRTAEKTKNTGGVLTMQLSRVYNNLGRVTDLIDGVNNTTTFTYDNNGNQITATDPRNNTTDSTYDRLNRLIESTDPDNGDTDYDYDARDNLVSVTDPRGLQTTYTYDGLNNLSQLDSPDTGIKTYLYDDAGNRTSMTDARSVTVDYEYDAINRLTKIDYAGTSLDITYNYDAGTNGKGRLTSMTDAVGSITYTYDARGNLLTETQVIDGHTFNLAYTYDGAGNLLTMTYPSGQVVTYTRDAGGRVTGISRFNGTTDILASNITYEPFGSMKSMTLGNGIQVTKTYDLAYRVTDIVQGAVMDRDYSYDAASNITGITDVLSSTKSQTFGYDDLNRLTSATGIYGSEAYVYDEVGSRTQSTINTVVTNYGYSSTSNRLTSIDSTTISYDSVGNITDDGSQQYVYDDRNRMVGADQGITDLGDYDYNGRGERVRKTIGAADSYFVFDKTGNLVAEADNIGTVTREYVYDQSMRLAITEGSSIYYFHPDHIGTPQKITNSSGSSVWSADYEPFGSLHAESGSLLNKLRFPGQHEDTETGLRYNYFRDYAPALGRYTQSDPIGLEAGINTYVYVESSPLTAFDKFGLNPTWFQGAFNTGRAFAMWCARNQGCRDWLTPDRPYPPFLPPAPNPDWSLPKPWYMNPPVPQECEDDIDCEKQAEEDERKCRMYTMPGTGARARCWQSVNERYGDCVAGRPLRPLVHW